MSKIKKDKMDKELKKENEELKSKLMEWEREAFVFDGGHERNLTPLEYFKVIRQCIDDLKKEKELSDLNFYRIKWEELKLRGKIDEIKNDAWEEGFAEGRKKAVVKTVVEEPKGDHVVLAMSQIARIAHEGGLIGFTDQTEALTEIRKLSLPWRQSDR